MKLDAERKSVDKKLEPFQKQIVQRLRKKLDEVQKANTEMERMLKEDEELLKEFMGTEREE